MIGLVLGLVIGIGLTLNLNSMMNSVGVSILGAGQSLPVQIEWGQMGWIVLGTLMITFCATIYPAFRAAKVQPATALRYE